MNAYGNSCPMCCGDLDDVAYLLTGAIVCLFCGWKTPASALVPPNSQGQVPMTPASSIIEIQSGSGNARPQVANI